MWLDLVGLDAEYGYGGIVYGFSGCASRHDTLCAEQIAITKPHSQTRGERKRQPAEGSPRRRRRPAQPARARRTSRHTRAPPRR
jgi:hypothetical protein